ncbi:MAG: hypothetical protein A2Z37_10000 [Chloroflexi bacterium RBG_19FT_COMBO_62_14]|nr:MAG: hypothetical protein A2Z37_10000 [Chloroflexi bacterium RBG_19FT_COMBO_62_14]
MVGEGAVSAGLPDARSRGGQDGASRRNKTLLSAVMSVRLPVAGLAAIGIVFCMLQRRHGQPGPEDQD